MRFAWTLAGIVPLQAPVLAGIVQDPVRCRIPYPRTCALTAAWGIDPVRAPLQTRSLFSGAGGLVLAWRPVATVGCLACGSGFRASYAPRASMSLGAAFPAFPFAAESALLAACTCALLWAWGRYENCGWLVTGVHWA